jgi:hypothetical protein
MAGHWRKMRLDDGQMMFIGLDVGLFGDGEKVSVLAKTILCAVGVRVGVAFCFKVAGYGV